jgi:hypothetical protein
MDNLLLRCRRGVGSSSCGLCSCCNGRHGCGEQVVNTIRIGRSRGCGGVNRRDDIVKVERGRGHGGRGHGGRGRLGENVDVVGSVCGRGGRGDAREGGRGRRGRRGEGRVEVGAREHGRGARGRDRATEEGRACRAAQDNGGRGHEGVGPRDHFGRGEQEAARGAAH